MSAVAEETTGGAPAADPVSPALDLHDLKLAYRVRGRDREVIRGVSFAIARGESYGLVGESGCGKSTVAMAAVRYLPRNGRITGGSVEVDGHDVYGLSGPELRRMRSGSVSMVYQNPSAALNPGITVGDQVAEVFWIHGIKGKEAKRRALEMLERVSISDPVGVMGRYPHQLSGGMQQRVVIAMALATDPALLILDEPTTGLDATVEAEVLDLVTRLREEFGTAVLFISHNLAVIGKMCDRVGVLYAGRLVEEGPTEQILHRSQHPYTVGLLRCIPQLGARKDRDRLDTIPGFPPHIGTKLVGCVYADRCALVQDICREIEPELIPLGDGRFSRCHFHEQAQDLPRTTPPTRADSSAPARGETPILQLEKLGKTFHQSGHEVRALVDVSAEIWAGETLGLVGESGSGKTTLARTVLGLIPSSAGVVRLDGKELARTLAGRDSDVASALQIVFQNPESALNRRHTVRRLLSRSLYKLSGLKGKEAAVKLVKLTRSVRLADRYLSARPSQLSGGLKQRVAIARAFAGDPRLVVCDEPTSALDVSVQAAILNLLVDLQVREQTTYLFISHDLGVVRYLSDRIAVLYLGRLMELGTAETVFEAPHHPYTEALLSAVPTLGGPVKDRIKLEGEIPSPANPPSGCVFHTRCPRRIGEICDTVEPPLVEVEPGHAWSCHYTIDELRAVQKSPHTATQTEVRESAQRRLDSSGPPQFVRASGPESADPSA